MLCALAGTQTQDGLGEQFNSEGVVGPTSDHGDTVLMCRSCWVI